MHARIFSAKINTDKTQLETAVEWHSVLSDALKQQIMQIHVNSFLAIYKDHSEKELGLKAGLTKREWLKNMIQEELSDVEKGKVQLAAVHVDGHVAGFVSCVADYGWIRRQELNKQRVKLEETLNSFESQLTSSQCFLNKKYCEANTRYEKVMVELDFQNNRAQELNADVYVSLLAVKQFSLSDQVRIGLGTQLMKSVEQRFVDANCITLDTRYINEAARAFYEHLGFDELKDNTFSGANALKYVGCEKAVDRTFSFT
jgi:ribosomal protein S18 acetylase RimI-like enzyme